MLLIVPDSQPGMDREIRGLEGTAKQNFAISLEEAKQKLRCEDEEVVVFSVEYRREDLRSLVAQWIKSRIDKSEVKTWACQ